MNPQPTSGSNVMTWVIGLIIVVILVGGAIYLLPRLRSAQPAPGTNINVTLPTGSGSSGDTTP